MSNARDGYIHTFLYDGLLFLFSPILCLFFVLIAHDGFLHAGAQEVGLVSTLVLLTSILHQGHIAAVVVRSHMNREIFKQHRWKILLAPIVLLVAMNLSLKVLIALGILWQGWIYYHYSFQHFGIARLYDAKRGYFSRTERTMDLVACLAISMLPIMIGSTSFFGVFAQYGELDNSGLSWLKPVFATISFLLEKTKSLQIACFAVICAAYVLFNLWIFYSQKRVSWQKLLFMSQLFLLFSFGWLYLDSAVGFLAMTILHSVQYYGLLSVSERKNLAERMKLTSPIKIATYTAAIVLLVGLLFGVFCHYYSSRELLLHPQKDRWINFLFSIVIMMNLVHFWFDGFIWSRPQKTSGSLSRQGLMSPHLE